MSSAGASLLTTQSWMLLAETTRTLLVTTGDSGCNQGCWGRFRAASSLLQSGQGRAAQPARGNPFTPALITAHPSGVGTRPGKQLRAAPSGAEFQKLQRVTSAQVCTSTPGAGREPVRSQPSAWLSHLLFLCSLGFSVFFQPVLPHDCNPLSP